MKRREVRAELAGECGRVAPAEAPEERRLIPDGRGLSSLLDAVTASGATVRIVAHGRSMLPMIRDGDALVVTPVAGPPSLGCVVAVAAPPIGRLLFHRVVARRGTNVLVRGDNVPRPDGWVELPAVLGTVERVERRGRAIWIGSGAARPVLALLCRTGILRFAARVLCHRWSGQPDRPA
jgi:hypothetical protein